VNDINFVAKRIYELRIQKNISSRKLSLELGLSNSYITQIENGQKMPSLENLINICNYFNITLADFFSTMGNNESISPEIKAVVESLKTLSPEDIGLIRKITERFKS
jgi:transcriptional regulator with XRE-family HTH domain